MRMRKRLGESKDSLSIHNDSESRGTVVQFSTTRRVERQSFNPPDCWRRVVEGQSLKSTTTRRVERLSFNPPDCWRRVVEGQSFSFQRLGESKDSRSILNDSESRRTVVQSFGLLAQGATTKLTRKISRRRTCIQFLAREMNYPGRASGTGSCSTECIPYDHQAACTAGAKNFPRSDHGVFAFRFGL